MGQLILKYASRNIGIREAKPVIKLEPHRKKFFKRLATQELVLDDELFVHKRPDRVKIEGYEACRNK